MNRCGRRIWRRLYTSEGPIQTSDPIYNTLLPTKSLLEAGSSVRLSLSNEIQFPIGVDSEIRTLERSRVIGKGASTI